MEEQEKFEIRSEEVQEILGTPPGWLVRWGTIVAFITVLALGWAGYWLRYPDLVTARVRVTSTEPPKKLIAETTAYISDILVQNEDTVEADQVLVVFKSKAKFEDVLVLDDALLAVQELTDSALLAFNPPRDLLLGEIQEDMYEFSERQDELAMTVSRRYEKLSIRQLNRQIDKIQSTINDEWSRQRKLQEQLRLVNERFEREQKLIKDGVLPKSKEQETQEEILALERERQGITASIKNKRFEIDAIKAQISGVRQGSVEEKYNASIQLKDSFLRLRKRVEDWKKKYLLMSPIHGVAVFTNDNISEQQFVPREAELMVVVPIKATEIIGRLSLDLSGSGKVKEGQRVIVKLQSYPFPEFGAVIGEVAWKGKIPTNNTIPIEVRFPKGLVTTTGRQLDPSQEMLGTAEIVTVDKRFIERIFERFRGATS